MGVPPQAGVNICIDVNEKDGGQVTVPPDEKESAIPPFA